MSNKYVATCGIPIVLDDRVRDKLHNVGSTAYLNIENDYGELKTFATVGDMYTYPNLSEPATLDYGSSLFDSMMAYISGDNVKADHDIAIFYNNDDIVKGGDDFKDTHLQRAESNIEYCLMGDKEDVIGSIANVEGKFSLLNPSKGTIQRMCVAGYDKYINDVDIIYGSDPLYVTGIRGIAKEYTIPIKIIHANQIDVNKFYYLSFNAGLGRKYKLLKYFGFDINYYACMSNGFCTAIRYNNVMTSLNYDRAGHNRSSIQYYKEKLKRYGSDSLVSRYKSSSYFNDKIGFCHDLVSTFSIYTEHDRSKIVYGRIMIANAYVLVGDYHHDDYNIYDSLDRIVYTSSMLNHSCRILHRDWKVLNGSGEMLSNASYYIGMFSSVCMFLGRKRKYVMANTRQRIIRMRRNYAIINGDKYCIGSGKDSVTLVDDHKGSQRIFEGNNESCATICPVFPHNSQLWQYFKVSEYCYGTYHNIVRETCKLKDELSSDEIFGLLFK